jgi:hypothetical protein
MTQNNLVQMSRFELIRLRDAANKALAAPRSCLLCLLCEKPGSRAPSCAAAGGAVIPEDVYERGCESFEPDIPF